MITLWLFNIFWWDFFKSHVLIEIRRLAGVLSIFRILVIPLEGCWEKKISNFFCQKKTNSKNNMNIKTITEVQTSQKLFGNERIRMGCVSISFPSTRVNSAEENGLINKLRPIWKILGLLSRASAELPFVWKTPDSCVSAFRNESFGYSEEQF